MERAVPAPPSVLLLLFNFLVGIVSDTEEALGFSPEEDKLVLLWSCLWMHADHVHNRECGDMGMDCNIPTKRKHGSHLFVTVTLLEQGHVHSGVQPQEALMERARLDLGALEGEPGEIIFRPDAIEKARRIAKGPRDQLTSHV